jgi:hypothetical protein
LNEELFYTHWSAVFNLFFSDFSESYVHDATHQKWMPAKCQLFI